MRRELLYDDESDDEDVLWQRRSMAERAAESKAEDVEAEDVPMVESIESLLVGR